MSEKITFKQLIEQISSQSEQSQNSTNNFLHELVQIIESGLQNSGSVSISGFGKFELRWMNERAGRNPQTGEEITIPGQNKVVFKPYKALRENVNRPYASMKPRVLEEENEENSGVKESSNQPSVSSTVTSSSTDSTDTSEEDVDLVVERSRPVEKKSEPTPKSTPTPKKNITKSNPFEAIPAQKDEVELVESVQESGSFKWSYAAASFVVMIAILAIIFFMMRPDTTNQTASSSQSDNTISQTNLTEQVTLAPAESITETSSTSEGEEELVEILEYQVAPGESLWSIAEDVYGDPYLWPLIYSTNKDQISNPNVLTSGVNLEVPTLSSSENMTQPQLDQVAAGYLSVYEWTQSNNPEQAKYFLWAVGNFSPDILAQASNRVNSNDLAFAENR